MKVSEHIQGCLELMNEHGDCEMDMLVEDLKEGGFGQIEQKVGGLAFSPGEKRIKILSEDFT